MAEKDFKLLAEIGSEIRKARENQRISLRKFSKLVDLSPAYYSKIERGEVKASPKAYQNICERLDLDTTPIIKQIGEIDPEIESIIKERQIEGKALFRTIGRLSEEEMKELAKFAEKLEGRKKSAQ